MKLLPVLRCLLLGCMLTAGTTGWAQELPPLLTFEAEEYGAGTQNWMLSQDDRGVIYVANNQGLLTYDGQRWRLYPTPNQSIMRSVRVVGDRIYTGSYRDFGYWTRGPRGSLHYTSLDQRPGANIVEDEQFWNILEQDGLVIFQSLRQLHLYDPAADSLRVISVPGGIFRSYRDRGELYVGRPDGALLLLEADGLREVQPGSTGSRAVVALLQRREQALALTTEQGLLPVGGTRSVPAPFLKNKRVYSAAVLRDGGMAVGTISSGVYILDAEGRVRHHIDQLRGLTNNTVLSLFEDARGNLWVGTDDGISCINLPSPFRRYTDHSGMIGTVHAAARVGDLLYVGSNQGLFVREVSRPTAFTLVAGTRGQVWSLFSYDEQLFCGHDKGTLLVTGRQVRNIDPRGGTWTFCAVPGQPHRLLQGSYYGLSILERDRGDWRLRNHVDSVQYSVRYLAAASAREVYFSHEYLGVFSLLLNEELTQVDSIHLYDDPGKSAHAGLAAYRDSIYYLTAEGLFVLHDREDGFRPRPVPVVRPAAYTSGRMTDLAGQLWFFDEYGLHALRRSPVADRLVTTSIAVGERLLDVKPGYESISAYGADTLLIGTADGYLLLDPTGIPPWQHALLLRSVTSYPTVPDSSPISLPLTDTYRIPYTERELRFSFAVPVYDRHFIPYFQHRLIGQDSSWSSWSPTAEVYYPSLPPGEYVLEVRSRLGAQLSEQPLRLSLRVQPPWYASKLALLSYLLLMLLLAWILHRSYTTYYGRQLAARERITQLEVTRLRNEQLQRDVAGKAEQVASSTMDLARKNDLLQRIRAVLRRREDPRRNTSEALTIIEDNLSEAEGWTAFQEAFKQTDQEFFRRAKELHPDLTPHDLRLCAYLRLNLTTKDIAPLLNISVRSVEVKRYRLRKRLNLDRDTNLTSYIMSW